MTEGNHSIELAIGDVSLSVAGSEEFVENQFYRLYEEHGFAELEIGEAPVTAGNQGGSGPEADGAAVNESGKSKDKQKTLGEYYADSEASTYQDSCLVVGWYLEYIEGQDDFTATEVKETADESKIALGTKVNRDLGKNVEKGYLHSPGEREGKDTYWVTDRGEDHLRELGIPA